MIAYYVVTAIFMTNYREIIEWCEIHNNSNFVCQFNTTSKNMEKFCVFIKTLYNSQKTIKYIECVHRNIFNPLMNKLNKLNSYEQFIKDNLLMTIIGCE